MGDDDFGSPASGPSSGLRAGRRLGEGGPRWEVRHLSARRTYGVNRGGGTQREERTAGVRVHDSGGAGRGLWVRLFLCLPGAGPTAHTVAGALLSLRAAQCARER